MVHFGTFIILHQEKVLESLSCFNLFNHLFFKLKVDSSPKHSNYSFPSYHSSSLHLLFSTFPLSFSSEKYMLPRDYNQTKRTEEDTV